MIPDTIWPYATPAQRDQMRTINEARAATYYAAWRALTAPLRALVRALDRTLGQARRAGETFRALNRLSDRQLQDIGISRSEIGSVANAIAAKPLATGTTLAELRQAEIVTSPGNDVAATPRFQAPRRPEAPVPQAVPEPCCREAA